jgi:hypothetical protein
MLEIAAKLGAHVQGDDGEAYTRVEQLADTLSPQDIKVLRRQRFIRIAGSILMVLAVALLIFRLIRWLRR